MIDWNFGLHSEFIERRGDLVIHEQGIACPACRGEDFYSSNILENDQPKRIRTLGCRNCQGDGFLYRNATPIRGLLTSIQSGANKQLIDSGFMIPGDCTFSPLLEQCPTLSDFDKITFTHAQPINEGQVILRNAARLGHNQTIPTDLTEDEDRLWYQSDCALWCEDEYGVVYKQGPDFLLQGRKIQWIGNRPEINTFYTVKYKAYLEWVLWASPFERIDHGRTLGPRVLLRKKHVYLSTGSPATTPAERKQEQEEFVTFTKI